MGLTFFSLQLLLFNSIVFVLETTLTYITNGDTTELVMKEVIKKKTMERAQEHMQYFKGYKFVLLKVCNIADAWMDIVFFNHIRFEKRRDEQILPRRYFLRKCNFV